MTTPTYIFNFSLDLLMLFTIMDIGRENVVEYMK